MPSSIVNSILRMPELIQKERGVERSAQLRAWWGWMGRQVGRKVRESHNDQDSVQCSATDFKAVRRGLKNSNLVTTMSPKATGLAG